MSDPTIDAAVGATLNGQAAAIRNSVNDALPVNPDAEAATRRYAAAANVPLDTARQMPDAVKQQAQMSTFNADVLARKFPTTAQLVANPDLARITHDDIPATAAVEQAVQAPSVEQHPAQNPLPGKAWTVGRVADYLASADGEHGLIFDAGSGVMSLLKGLGGTFNKLAEGVNTVLGSAPVLYDKAAGTEHADWWFRNMVDPAVEHEGAFALGPDATFADKGAHAAGSLLGTIAQIVLSGGAGAEAAVPAAADSVAGAVGSAAAHGVKSMALPALNEAVNTGREVYQTTGGDGQAAFKAAAAAYGTTSAMGVMPLSASGGLFTRAITGGVSGLATGEANRRVMNAALPDSMQTQFNWEDAFMNAATGSVLGGVLGPRTSTPGAAKAVRDTYTETYQAAKTEAQAQQLTDIAKAANASKLRERDPEAFKQFVADAADGGSLQNVYIEGSKLAEILQQGGVTADEVRQQMPTVADQMNAALGENAPRNALVSVPIEDFATHIAGSKFEQSFLENARVSPDSGTVGETESFKQTQAADMQARAESIAAAHGDSQIYHDSVTQMNAQVDANLAGLKMRPDQLDTNSALLRAFYKVQADRVGVLPHEFAEKYPVTGTNRALEGAKLRQGADVPGIEDDLLGPAAALLEAGKNEGLFQYPKSSAKSLGKIAAAKSPGLKVKSETITQMDGSEKPTGNWDITLPDGDGSAILTRKGDEVWINVAGLKSGGRGSLVYDLAANYAHSNGLKFIGDPAGVSKAAMVRRSENMLSSAVKYGTTDHLAPHPDQLKGNDTVPPLAWEHGKTLENVRSLMDATTGANAKLAPLADGIRYDAEHGTFHDSSGAAVDGKDLLGFLSDVGRGEAGAGAPGEATLRRNALFDSLLQGEGARRAILDGLHRVGGDGSADAGGALAGSFYQGELSKPAARGEYSPAAKTIALLKDANLSTFQHELGHYFIDTLGHMAAQADAPAGVKADMAALLKWGGVHGLDSWHEMSIDEQRELHEKFATGWETYLMKGQAPSLELRSLFQRFRSWMISVYQTLKGAPGDFTPEVRGVMDRMIASEDAIHQAELARKYMPLFDSPEKSGMTPEEWAAYQAQGKDATEQAIENLIGKTMKDMAKTDRLRTASLKTVQKDAAAKRQEITLEVRSEVMRTPVYRAWSFLTGKDSAQLPDQINAEHQQALRDWSEKREEHQTESASSIRAKAWEDAPASKGTYKNAGLAKGQWLAKNRARIDLDVKREMLDYDQEHPKPIAPEKPDTSSKDATTGAGKLNTDALREVVGPEITKKLQALKMTSGKGMEPGVVADMFGFADAGELAKALTDVEPPRAAVEGMVDQRMLERHGEIANPEAMARTADELVQNEVRSQFVATELRALKKATGKPREMVAAAKEAAQNTIDVKRIRDINEAQFTAAETRSATQAEKAMMKGDTQGAAVAKRDQLLNMELGRAARDAKDFVAKSLTYLVKFDKASVREGIDLDYRDQIDALLDRADLRKSVSGKALDKRASLESFVEKMAAQGYKPDIAQSLLDEAARWHYKDMPLEAFRGLVDAVKSIEHLGKLKSQLQDLQETRAIGVLADEVKASAAKLPQREAESNRGLTRIESAWIKTKAYGRSAQASLLKMEQMFDWLDGRNPNGALNRVVFRRLSDAGVHENTLQERVKSEIDHLVESHLDDIAKTKGIFTADGLVDSATGAPQKFTTKEMLMLAGNVGNESNMAKLLKGEGWNEQAVWDFLNKNMTPAHWDFVEGMGRTLESLWPEKLAMDRRLGNTSPEKIQPRPFTTPDGKTRSGWYWPMMYDPARAQDVAERGARQGDALFENIYSKANTDTGRMNTRSENYARPLLLDLDALPRMIKDEIHDVAWREAVIDADRFTSHPVVRKAIVDSLSQEHYDQIRPWLQSIANDGKLGADGDRGFKWLNRVASEARTRATMVGLGFRLTTAAVHGMSAGAESIAELGPVWFASGLKDFTNPVQWGANKDFIFERSGEMRNRMNEVDRDIREHLRTIDTKLMDPTSSAMSRGADLMRSHAYTLIGGLDMASALPTWMGAYKKGMSPVEKGGLGLGEQDAIYFADKTVRNAHGGTGVKDMAAIQRGTEFQKLFTMFYTFWNHNVNRLIDTAKLVGSSEHRAAMKDANHWSTSQLAATIIMRTLVYTIGVQTMHALLHPPKDGDPDSWGVWAAKEMGAVAFGGIPVARDLYAHYVTGRDYSVTPAAGLVDMLGKSGQDAADALTGKQVNDKWLKHTITTAGAVFNLPSGQAASTAQFLWDVHDGKADPQGVSDWFSGIMHGDLKHH